MNDFSKDKIKKRAFRYALAVFILIMFLWWFTTGGTIISFENKPVPAQKTARFVGATVKNGIEAMVKFIGF